MMPLTFKHCLTLTCLIGLSACQTPKASDSGSTDGADMDKLLSRAAQNAEASGQTEKSLSMLARLYQRNADKPQAALRYAQALRKANQAGKGVDILNSFLNQHDGLSDLWRVRLYSELAMAQLSQGTFRTGQTHAKKAVGLGAGHDDRDVKNAAAKAHHILGVALDAQGKHNEAEAAFRKGLANWSGDPVPIMNNLALSLANQGHLDEAIKIIEKARETAPERRTVERNLRILRTMNEEVDYHIPPPPPAKKPESG